MFIILFVYKQRVVLYIFFFIFLIYMYFAMPRRHRTRRSRNPRNPRNVESQAIDDGAPCWRGFTSLEKRLLKIIVVEISFLLICAAIHVAFSSSWSNSGKCTDLCQIKVDDPVLNAPQEKEENNNFADIPDDLAIFVNFQPSFFDEKVINTCNTTRKRSTTSTTRKPRGTTINETRTEMTTETTTQTTEETTTEPPLVPIPYGYARPNTIAIMKALYKPDQPYYIYTIMCTGTLLSDWYAILNNDGCVQSPLYDEYENGDILRWTIRTVSWARVTSDNDDYYGNPKRVFITKLLTFKEVALITFNNPTNFDPYSKIWHHHVKPKMMAVTALWPLKENISYIQMADLEPVYVYFNLTLKRQPPVSATVSYYKKGVFYVIGLTTGGKMFVNVTQGEYYDWLTQFIF